MDSYIGNKPRNLRGIRQIFRIYFINGNIELDATVVFKCVKDKKLWRLFPEILQIVNHITSFILIQ